MPMKRSQLDVLSEMTAMTGSDEGGDMASALNKMENIMNGKKQKKSQKIGELHSRLLTKVKDELNTTSAQCGTTRESCHEAMKTMVKDIKTTGAELTEIEQALYQKFQEMEDCAKVLGEVMSTTEALQEKRHTIELDHRTEVKDNYKQLKNNVEDVLNQCMKGLSKNYEATAQMKRMRQFLHQLETAE
eukprot:TRINITY_DN17969_c0_g1_i1.p1 TRINITY_DN17969_c0_g1~~TRINITY_DN17969_c0_g1_i1.p1  ORF type:complete len:206 (+),score=80.48 TRINITY_DN17969_c0_g1_i1:56-619(+)